MAYGLGCIFIFFIIKSQSNIFSMGTRLGYEILSREEGSGIPVDHPKNPARILHNMSNSFMKTFRNCLEYNSLTNMGLCLFQDFFVIKTVFDLDRGYTNALAIYSMGMIGSLIAMVNFRRKAKFKLSETNDCTLNYTKLRKDGVQSMFLAGAIILAG